MIKSGLKTTEFLATAGGMFLTALLALLATFNVVTVTPEQKQAIFEFTAAAWIFLPIAYTWGRSYVKGKSVSPASATASGGGTAIASESGSNRVVE